MLRDQLAGLGLKDAQFRVEHLGTDSFAVTDFSASPEISFDRLAVGYSAGELLHGRLARIRLTGLRVDLTQPGPWAAKPGIKAETTEAESGRGTGLPFDPATLPILDVLDARIKLAGPGGPVTVNAEAHLRPNSGGDLAIRAEASATGPPGRIDATYDGAVRIGQDGSGAATGRLSARSASLTAGKATVGGLTAELPLSLDLTADGAAALTAKAVRITASRFTLAPGVETGPVTLSFTGHFVSAQPTGTRFQGNADIAVNAESIRAADLTAGRATATVPVRLTVTPGAAIAELVRDARLAVEGIGGRATKLSTLVRGRIAVARPANDAGFEIDHRLSLVAAPVTLPGPPETRLMPGKIDAAGRLAANGAYEGRIHMDPGRFSRDSRSMAVGGADVRLTSGPGLATPNADITVHGIQDLSAATVLGAPVAGSYDLTATVRLSGDRLTYEAAVGGLGKKTLATAAGSHDIAARTGQADISVPEFALGADGIKPASAIPALAAIRKAAGRVGGAATLAWSRQGLDGHAKLTLDRIGFETDNGTVDGLGGTIVFDRLVPLATAPEQLLHIRKIDAGAALTDMSVRFALSPGGILRIDRAEANFAGGKIALVAPAVDLVAQKATASVSFEDVRLEQVLALADLGDLHATGRLHGAIPIRIADGKIAINAGALTAKGGGTLRFKSERAKQILKGGGDQVALMLQALEDFSYERLGVDIDKSITGNARVTLRTLGHNPAVLHGRKFQINVNLETNLDRLLDAALQWYRLSGRALRDIVAPRKRKGNANK